MSAIPTNASPEDGAPSRAGTTVYSARGSLTSCIKDFGAGLRMTEIWLTFALDDMRQRYRRSALGLSWIVISFAIFVAGITFFFGAFNRQEPGEFLAYVAIGYAVFLFLIGNIVDGCAVFVNSQTWIKSISMPYSVHVYRSIFRSLFVFAMNLAVALGAMLLFGWRPELSILLTIPAFFVFLINAVAIQYLLGLLGARYRDVTHFLASITRILIFTTPILWVREEQTGPRALVADINPLTHFLEIFRAPLLGEDARLLSWGVVLGFTAFAWIAALIVGARWRKRLPYWL